MKKIFIPFVFIFICVSGYTQDLSKIKNAREINWYGLDFTKSKMIGSLGFSDPDVICERYIKNKWNGIVFAESEKYDIGSFTGGKEVKMHLDYIMKRNEVITTEGLIINSEYEIKTSDIQDMIKTYPDAKGIGLVFIVESFNKLNDTANIWVTFFDNQSKQVLKTRKYASKPGGISVRNYWLGGVYQTCKQLKKDYKKW